MVELDKFEDELIEQFRNHTIFQQIELIQAEELLEILLQRRFLSFTFTTVYDMAIDALSDNVSVRIAREILREEYPDSSGRTPSHREDLFHDLIKLGAMREQILRSLPTRITDRVIKESLALVTSASIDNHSDVRLLTMLRFWGEVLVSVEYGEYWRRLSKIFNGHHENRSCFYYLHFMHDAKSKPMAEASSRAATHSDRLAIRLRQLVNSDEAKEAFMTTERKILSVKMKFYDQFVTNPL